MSVNKNKPKVSVLTAFMSYKDIQKIEKNKVKEMVLTELHTANEATFLMGGLLERVHVDTLYYSWNGKKYDDFGTWCEAELGFRKRKAECLMLTFRRVDAWKLPQTRRAELIDMGWSKAYQACRVATADNIEEWIDTAKKMAHRELLAAVQAEIAEANGVPANKKEAEAAAEADDDGDEAADKKHLVMKIKFADVETYENVQHALTILAKRVKTENNGKLLGLLAMNYLSMHTKDKDGGMAVELEHLIESIENSYGVELVVKQTKTINKSKKKAS